MTDSFQEALAGLSGRMATMCRLAKLGLRTATSALFHADLGLAQDVISKDLAVDELRDEIEHLSLGLLGAPEPVMDPRAVVAGLRMADHLERMGDLARHVAKLARLHYPGCAVPGSLRPMVAQMSQVAEQVAARTTVLIASGDLTGAAELDRLDDRMDRLQLRSFELVVDPGWSHGVQGAIDLTLLTRYYERFADHAVEAGRGVALLAVLPASGCNGGQDAPVAPGVLTRVRHRLGPRPRTC